MNNKLIKLSAIILILLLPAVNALAQNETSDQWLQFRGQDRNGTSAETGLLDKWPTEGPEMVWKKDLGSGYSEILITNDRFYTMFSEQEEGKGSEFMGAFNLETGDEIWRTEVDSIFIDLEGWGDGPRSTPVIDAGIIYCFSSFGKLSAISSKDGKIKWQQDFKENFNSPIPRWAFSPSPIIIDDVLMIEAGGTDSRTFAAFNKKNGKVLWTKGVGASSYSSPAIADIDGKTQVIFTNDTMMYSFDTKGNEYWTYRIPLRSPTATPLFIAPNKIFSSSVSRTGGFMVEVNGKEVKEVFNNVSMKNDWSSSCYQDGYIYGFSNAKLVCISEKDGAVQWGKRGFGKGSLILVDGNLIVLSDKGKLVQIEATPKEYKQLSIFQALTGKSWTAPSFANGKVFVRNLSQMACFKLK